MGDGVATDISGVEDAVNSTFTDSFTDSGGWSAAGSNRGVTKFEEEFPTLELDGTDDFYLSSIPGAAFSIAGSFALAIKALSPISNYGTPIGGGAGSPAIVSDSTNPNWGLGAPGGFTAPDPVTLDNDEWFVFIARWTGTAFKYTTWQDGVRSDTTPTGPGGFNGSATGFMALGAHVSDAPFSYFKGRYVMAGAHTTEWSDSQVTDILNEAIRLIPTP